MVLALGWTAESYVAQTGTAREIRHPLYAPEGRHGPAHDIALIFLDQKVEAVIPLPPAQVSEDSLNGTKLAVMGYHIDAPNQLSGRLDCPAIPFNTGLLHLGCPVIQGNSGAPVLRADAQGNWQVVGVISSRIGAGAIAVMLPDWLMAQIAAHEQARPE